MRRGASARTPARHRGAGEEGRCTKEGRSEVGADVDGLTEAAQPAGQRPYPPPHHQHHTQTATPIASLRRPRTLLPRLRRRRRLSVPSPRRAHATPRHATDTAALVTRLAPAQTLCTSPSPHIPQPASRRLRAAPIRGGSNEEAPTPPSPRELSVCRVVCRQNRARAAALVGSRAGSTGGLWRRFALTRMDVGQDMR